MARAALFAALPLILACSELDRTRVKAHLGGVASQLQLAHRYGTGDGVGQDEQEAFRWYQRAARRGNSSAQVVVGARYAQGLGVDKDEAKAAEWFLRAAELGNPEGQF